MRFIVTEKYGDREWNVLADFMTTDICDIYFWIKPHWYSRRRQVGYFSGSFVVSTTEIGDDREFLKELRVTL